MRDKPVLSLVEETGWTKRRSRTCVAAMGIVKYRERAECDNGLAGLSAQLDRFPQRLNP
jgi:hypothetical protein